jgi:hypothetical protein
MRKLDENVHFGNAWVRMMHEILGQLICKAQQHNTGKNNSRIMLIRRRYPTSSWGDEPPFHFLVVKQRIHDLRAISSLQMSEKPANTAIPSPPIPSAAAVAPRPISGRCSVPCLPQHGALDTTPATAISGACRVCPPTVIRVAEKMQ